MFVSQIKKSWVTVDVVSLPPTPPPEVSSSPLWSSNAYENQQEELSPTESNSVVAVIGVGYVGTHLVEAFASRYNVIAFDLSERRLQEVSSQLKGLPIHFTSSPADISEASHILISVPTILNEDKRIDTTYLRSAIATVEKYVKSGSTIIIESSVAVGMTRQLVGPLMASKNLKVGMSPERVDPGRTFPAFEDIPKIVSGLDAASLESISQLYGRVFRNLLPVSSPEVAEMTKLYENCQRMVCAAYANEMADACDTIGIDAFEVSQAAASKPFGYLPFRPGPGIGGHCIPVNPYYLLSTCSMPLLEHATTKSWQRPAEVAKRFVQSLLQEKAIIHSTATANVSLLRILVVGVGFKRGQSVMSNSPGAAIIRTLRSEYNLHVEFADPLVSTDLFDFVPKFDTAANWNTTYLSTFDGIIVAVDQFGLDMDILAQLQGVKVQDYSGRLKNFTNGVPSLSTPATFDLLSKGC
ncbi:nucleotide sugar dehydrogenase [Melanomma pulvis-pyrius CBS 109.77]|uniref:Nucleotide sugar dehydrogenase n=1 Tax=Melanomma pulvis-pyrius CBS 109.77 TaxID=1314802 RepID=A0A6A6XCK5_9PLEO|nr:nucleotide sugar dehydrogenase [Melanomma pulvis-pyrius CBS 109.77]